jgi:hypothetical protein
MMQRKHPGEAMTGAPGALPGEAIRFPPRLSRYSAHRCSPRKAVPGAVRGLLVGCVEQPRIVASLFLVLERFSVELDRWAKVVEKVALCPHLVELSLKLGGLSGSIFHANHALSTR